ncbi:MAG: hypothetical protein J2P28_23035 [Actinobacteria bacterium]|nr:hypothetical protein [Actinomycetota bacterium]
MAPIIGPPLFLDFPGVGALLSAIALVLLLGLVAVAGIWLVSWLFRVTRQSPP